MSNWVVNPDGTVTVTLAVNFDGSFDPLGTGTATITVTPDGGASTLAALLDGDPGMPATIRNVPVTTVLPSTPGSGSVTLVSAGGPGESSVYDLNLSVPQGETGATGATGTIMAASDLTNTATAGYVLVAADASHGTWVPFQPIRPRYTVPASSFTALSGTTGTASGVLVALTVPAQTFRWRPIVSADVDITSAADTRIDCQAMMGPSTSTAATIAATGTQVAYGRGQASATSFHVGVKSVFGVAMTPSDSSPAAVVAAGTAQTIVLSAVRQYGTSVWSTSNAPNITELSVVIEAV